MDQSISKQFHEAFLYLLNREGRGAQARIADRYNIDRGQLNAIVERRRPGSEEVRTNIAAYFQMTYEEMLAFGRRLIQEKEQSGKESKAIPTGRDFNPAFSSAEKSAMTHNNDEVVKAGMAALGMNIKISEKIQKTVEILESVTNYRVVMASMIDAFHEAVTTKTSNVTLMDKVKAMENQLANVGKDQLKEKISKGKES